MANKTVRTKKLAPIAVFKLLSDHNRYETIKALLATRKGLVVGEIAEMLDASQSTTSHFLSLLLEEGVVICKKEGREVRYLLASTPVGRIIARVVRSV